MTVTRDQERRWEALSPFELKNELISLADEHHRLSADAMLNAGRGNPNWTAIPPREAFWLLGRFGTAEAKRDWDEWASVGGMPQKAGIADRFAAFLDSSAEDPGADLLRRSLDYGVQQLGFDADTWVHELTDSVIGDNYPVPDRMLRCIEQVVHEYIVREMNGDGERPAESYDLFATEGGTAAMCYIFDTLQNNRLLAKGDKIALLTPIFTPYLEIPELERFAFDVVEVRATATNADGVHTWQFPEAELAKLEDPAIRLLGLVNPSNPPSVMLPEAARRQIADIVANANPNLAIVTDDVYGTFVPGFRSLMTEIPRNTIGVYSFSKYFGCTGWRLGVVAVNRDNVFDEQIAAFPDADTQALNTRYGTLTLEPAKLRFIDRMVADSRDVALNHTAGLSLPQQVQMGLFALFALLDEHDEYKRICQEILARRMNALLAGTGVPLPEDPHRAGYYVELDLLSWAERHWGPAFASWMKERYEPVDPLFRLAEQHSIVLLNGGGFDAPEWSVRISLANLRQDAYERIGRWLRDVGEEYLAEYERDGGRVPEPGVAPVAQIPTQATRAEGR